MDENRVRQGLILIQGEREFDGGGDEGVVVVIGGDFFGIEIEQIRLVGGECGSYQS